MNRFAVIGSPIKHSLSPRIHTAYAKQLGIELSYNAIEVPEADFEAKLAMLRSELQGANITLPFKERAFALADQASEAATQAQAANTLVFSDGNIYADNTDGSGLVRDLMSSLGLQIEGARVLILGAGGAVRGVLPALLHQNPQAIHLLNRTPAKAQALVDAFQDARLSLFHEQRNTQTFDLIINGTSAGISGEKPKIPDSAFNRDSFVYDMLYSLNDLTPCSEWSREKGLKFSDGLGMLIEQAADAFALWHAGQRPNTQAIRDELRAAQP